MAALRRGVHDAWALVHETRYSQAAAIMPTLIADCELAVRDGGEPWLLLAELYQAVAAMMSKVGEADAAWVAADRSISAALQAGDMKLAAAASFRLGHAFLNAGKPEQARRAAEAATMAVKLGADSGDRDATVLWGALSLVRAIAAARLGEARAAASAMSEAEQAADQLGPSFEDRHFHTEFGAMNVGLHAVAVAAELGDAPEAVRQANGIDTGTLSPERRARLLVDVARAHAHRRNGRAAMRALEEAERLGPEMVRCHWLARETLRDLLRRERTRMKPSRLDLAVRMGLVSTS
jgi:hypothetical protein